MSGLGEAYGAGQFGAIESGVSVQQKEVDQYVDLQVNNPTTNTAWFSAGTSTGTTVQAMVVTNVLADWPRNAAYAFTGGTSGGTITANWIDQFGVPVIETVSLGSVAGGGTTYGTAIVAKFVSGTVFPNTSTTGTYTLGFGTLANGSAQSNWFGLLTKIAGTSDVKNIGWCNNGTQVALNKGTAIGTLVNTTTHSFQGTSGVAITDRYNVILKPTYDNTYKGTMSGL